MKAIQTEQATNSVACASKINMELSAPKILEDLVAQATRAGASDIHLQMRDGAAQHSEEISTVGVILSKH
jgi:type II secretory ATPase GspE/PulE/Tfp pilus assembly ATPase PilB-like protein